MSLIENARRLAGLSQAELARRAGTSRPTLSAYENGRKSPTLATVERLVESSGLALSLQPKVTFRSVAGAQGRPFHVADRLWRLPVREALGRVSLPLELNWSQPGAVFDLSDPRQRARCYEIVLREGRPVDILAVVDGAFLVEGWTGLVVPQEIREEWQPLIDGAVG